MKWCQKSAYELKSLRKIGVEKNRKRALKSLTGVNRASLASPDLLKPFCFASFVRLFFAFSSICTNVPITLQLSAASGLPAVLKSWHGIMSRFGGNKSHRQDIRTPIGGITQQAVTLPGDTARFRGQFRYLLGYRGMHRWSQSSGWAAGEHWIQPGGSCANITFILFLSLFLVFS